MKVIATGISGSGRGEYLRRVVEYARSEGKEVKLFDVGKMMFDTAEKLGIRIPEDKILDLAPSTLSYLRTTVFEQILRESREYENIIVSTHACFRWRRHLLQAFDFHYLDQLKPNMYISIVDSIASIKARLEAKEGWRGRLMLKDIIVWRDEEVFITKSVADFQRKPFYVIAYKEPAETLYRLMFEPDVKKTYLSYPITHSERNEENLRRKDKFRDKLREAGLIVFDPMEIEDVRLLEMLEDNRDGVEVEVDGFKTFIPAEEIRDVAEDIQHQTVANDYQLIDQSDFVTVYYYLPVMSPGVLSEMTYGFTNNKHVYVVFEGPESPFFRYYSTRIFKDEGSLLKFYYEEGYIKRLPGNDEAPIHG